MTDDEIVHEMLFGPLPDLVVPPAPEPTVTVAPEVITWQGCFRARPYPQTFVDTDRLLERPELHWSDKR